ncbi:unnamed protein product, partial [Amoebophrya sp. A25]|eukprot:GSA25T00023611001.1
MEDSCFGFVCKLDVASTYSKVDGGGERCELKRLVTGSEVFKKMKAAAAQDTAK